MTTDVGNLDGSFLSDSFRVTFPEHPTYSLLRTKAGVIGRPIRETHGDVMDQVAARSGVIRVSNGFRCPDTMSNGGTFTDAMGSTCGVRIVMGAMEQAQEATQALADAADERRSAGAAISKIVDAGDPLSSTSRARSNIEKLGSIMTTAKGSRRIRFTEEDFLPEATDPDLAGQAVDLIRAQRPENIYSGLHRDLSKNKVEISDDDIAGDTYLRSLGMAVLTEVLSPNSKASKKLAKIAAAREKEREKLTAEMREGERLINEVIPDELEDIDFGFDEFIPGLGPGMRMKSMSGFLKDGKLDRNSLDRSNKPGSIKFGWYTWNAQAGKDTVNVELFIEAADTDTPGRTHLFVNINGKRVEAKKPPKHGIYNKRKETVWNMQQFLDDGYLPSKHGTHDEFMRNHFRESESPLGEIIRSEMKLQEANMTAYDLQFSDQDRLGQEIDIVRDAIYETMYAHGFDPSAGLEGDPPTVIPDRKSFKTWAENPSGIVIVGPDFESDEERESAINALDAALRHFPAAWHEKIKKRGLVLFRDPKAKDRAYANISAYKDGFGMINIDSQMLADPNEMNAIMLHELTHINQNFNPEITEAEFVSFSRRVTPDDVRVSLLDLFPNSNYRKDEIAVPDDADSAYVFKVYNSADPEFQRPFKVSEMSSMLMEMLFSNRSKFGGDLDLAALMIGILMDHGAPK